MSHDICKYCQGYAYKTNGAGEYICLDRANSGTCDPEQPDTVQQMKEYERDSFDSGKSIREVKRKATRLNKGKRKYGYK